jgi:hypothetical protein
VVVFLLPVNQAYEGLFLLVGDLLADPRKNKKTIVLVAPASTNGALKNSLRPLDLSSFLRSRPS